MKLLSEILSKRILNIYSAKIEGVVSNAVFDGKKIQSLKYFGDDEEEYLLDTSKIYSLQNDFVVVKNNSALSPAINLNDDKRLIGLEVLTETGKDIGVITDIEIGDTYNICALYIDANRIDIDRVLCIGDVVVTKENDKVSLATFRPQKAKIKPKKTASIVSIMPENIEDNDVKVEFDNNKITLVEKLVGNNAERKDGDYKISQSPAPQKVVGIGTGTYLVGRKVTKTIYGLNNELLVKKDMTITEDILNRVKNHSKLMELALFAKDTSSKKKE